MTLGFEGLLCVLFKIITFPLFYKKLAFLQLPSMCIPFLLFLPKELILE